MKYTSYNELKDKILSLHDTVIFTIGEHQCHYYTTYRYMSNLKGRNDEIFKWLNLDKWEFCENCFGYRPTNYSNRDRYSNTSFPETESTDYAALTRTVLVLFKICEQNNTPKFNQIKII